MRVAVIAGAVLSQARAEDRELIQDQGFQRGFILWKTEPGKLVRYGELTGANLKAAPVWSLYQWSSRFPLDNSMRAERADDLLAFKNVAKTVAVGLGKQTGVLSLSANTGVEYGPHARTSSEPWVHLLVQQEFAPPAALGKLNAAKLHVAARLLRSRNLHANDYSADVHAAQFQIFFTVQNLNPHSAGHGDYLWFGVPIYDNRSRFPKAFKEQDFGGTAKYIYTPGGEVYTNSSAHDGQWLVIDKDLLPLMRDALNAAWERGFLKASKDVSDYGIAGMNMGWELPGTFDVEMQIKDLSLTTSQEK